MTELVIVRLEKHLSHSLMQATGTGKSHLKFQNGGEETVLVGTEISP